MLEAERDVVERMEEDHPRIRRHVLRERIGREGAGLGGDLAPSGLGKSRLDVAVAIASCVEHQDACGRERNDVAEAAPDDLLVGAHPIAEQRRVLRADLLRRAREVRDAHAAHGRPSLAGTPHAVGLGPREVDRRERGRFEPRHAIDREMRDERRGDDHAERDQLLLVTPRERGRHQPLVRPKRRSRSAPTTVRTMRHGSRTTWKWVTRSSG